MNIHTFKDATTSKRNALVNDIDEDDDDDVPVRSMKRNVEGEEDDGKEKFNDAGEVIEAFNLNEEREGGYFDENMNYVFAKEKGEVDTWVASLGNETTLEQAIGEASRAAKRKQQLQEEEDRKELNKVKKSPNELKTELLSLILPGENIMIAMRRLGGKSDTSSSGDSIKRRRPPGKANTVTSKDNAKNASNSKQIERITEIADELLMLGLSNIYNLSYESISNSTKMWEYKGADDKIYGPYTAQQISNWKNSGYLTGASAVMMRSINKSTNSSIFDDDMFADTATTTTNNNNNNNKRMKTEVSEWIHSDAIDFGEFVSLDEQQKQQQNAGTRSANDDTLNDDGSQGNEENNYKEDNDSDDD